MCIYTFGEKWLIAKIYAVLIEQQDKSWSHFSPEGFLLAYIFKELQVMHEGKYFCKTFYRNASL